MYDRRLMRSLRDQLKAIYGAVCMKCGDKRRICVEHILSRAIGGSNDLANLQLLCWPCNSKKGLDVVDYRPSNWRTLMENAEFADQGEVLKKQRVKRKNKPPADHCQLTVQPKHIRKRKPARKNKK